MQIIIVKNKAIIWWDFFAMDFYFQTFWMRNGFTNVQIEQVVFFLYVLNGQDNASFLPVA